MAWRREALGFTAVLGGNPPQLQNSPCTVHTSISGGIPRRDNSHIYSVMSFSTPTYAFIAMLKEVSPG